MRATVIGNFDGVHCGHRHLLRLAREAAAGGPVVAVTFEPHPRAVLAPEAPVERLTSAEERRELLVCQGLADEVVELTPTSELLGRTAAEFTSWLHQLLRFDLIAVGGDFRFGRARAGDVALLRAEGARLGFDVLEVDAVEVRLPDGRVVEARSSAVRLALAEGRVADAAAILGRPYELRATTERGDQRGRTIGWPTANLATRGRLLPAPGVYAGEATLPDGRTACAAISIGTKPTFGEHALACEATLLGDDGLALGLPLDWYGWTVRLRFLARVREQRRFASVEALLAEMERDRGAVRAAFAARAAV